MNQIPLILVFCIVLVAVSNAGPGCEWSGCREFGGLLKSCTTGVTGQSGRSTFHKSSKCGFLNAGQRQFCCDPACKHEACGKICSSLGKTSWANEIGNIDCILDVPGVGPIPTRQEFCCP